MASKGEKLLAKGRAFAAKGKLDKALAHYRQACEADPYDPEPWMLRAEEAERAGLKPEAADAFFRAADLFARGGMPAEALKLARRVLDLAPDNGAARRFVRMFEARIERDEGPEDEDHDEAPAGPSAAPAGPSAAPAGPSAAPAGPSAAPAPPAGAAAETPLAPPSAEAAAATPPVPPPAEAAAETPPVPPPADEPPEPISIEMEADEPEPSAPPDSAPPPVASRPPVAAHSLAAAGPLAAEASTRAAPAATAHAAGSSPTAAETSGGTVEFVVGVFTGELALATISLAERLPSQPVPGERPDTADAREISLEEDGKLDVIEAVASAIGSSPLLSELDSDLLHKLVDCGRLVHRPAGQVVFRQGDPGASLFLVLTGEVAVEREEKDRARRELARLRAGAFFGEMALLTNVPRTATVRATREAHLLEIARRDVRALIDRQPRVLKLLMRFFRARLVGTLLQTSPLFRPFTREERQRVIALFRLREVGAGREVIREGTVPDGLFVVLVGALEVTCARAGARAVLGTLGAGDVFGEMSLLEGSSAVATVRALARSWILVLPRDGFAAVASTHPEMRDQLEAIAAERRERNAAALAGDPLRPDKVEPV